MGEVYRARDPRIGREVAIKILPPAFVENPDRRRRFEQEARATGAVNHPNLLTVFDVGTHDGIPFIVSELLEGATLREKMRQPMQPKRAIEYALQIARAAAAAHDKGIVHRDLKPDNIFITEDERVKLLDFGLAKLLQSDKPAGPVTEAATQQKQNTAEGAVLGTVAYMSPEQVRGQGADHRSDIFSFGVVLYEMLTGSRPFKADSNVETMAAIIHDDPPSLPSSTPGALERIVMHAMEKTPSNRFQSMRDVVFALDTFSGSGETSAVTAKAAKASKSRAAKKEDAPRIARFERITFRRGFIMTARFAPDGSVVYGATWEDHAQELFSVVPGNPESRAAGFPNADILSIARNGELAISIGRRFLAGWVTSGTLARVPPFGGAPRELADDVQDADWDVDGESLVVIRHRGGNQILEAPVGTVVYETHHWISNVRVSPRGDHFAFVEHELWGDDGGRIVILGRNGKRIAESRRWPSIGGLAWTPSGDEVWIAAEGMRRTREIEALSVGGKERTVLPVPARATMHDISREGRVLIGVENGRREILAGSRSGERERNISWLDWSFPGGISRDGSRIVFEEQAGGKRQNSNGGSVYVRGVDGSPAVRLGDGVARGFSPDGSSIGIWSDDDSMHIVPIRLGNVRKVPLHGLKCIWWDWVPDGKRMIIWGNMTEGANRHFVLELDGSQPPRAVTPPGTSFNFAVSADGSRIVAATVEGELLMFNAEGGEPSKIAGSQNGDRAIQWSEDGGSIFVVRSERAVATIDRLELSTGNRTKWHVLRPDDPSGVMDIFPIVMTRDGEKYAYSFRRFLSDLYVVDDLR
jgi:hypothetical protein